MRTLPRTTDTHRWYRVRGKRRPARVVRLDHRGTPATPSEGKAREASRGSSPEGDAHTQTRPRRPGGSREGRINAEMLEQMGEDPA